VHEIPATLYAIRNHPGNTQNDVLLASPTTSSLSPIPSLERVLVSLSRSSKYCLLKLSSSQKLTAQMTEARKKSTTEGPRRISFRDRLLAARNGAAIGFILGFLGFFFVVRDHPAWWELFAMPAVCSSAFAVLSFLGGHKMVELIKFLLSKGNPF
jgi:hypothetical protein